MIRPRWQPLAGRVRSAFSASRRRRFLPSPAAVESLEERVMPAAGALDTRFSGDGRQTVAFDRANPKGDHAYAVAIDSAGRSVMAGIVQEVGSGNTDFGITRINVNGSLDTTFGSGGRVVVPFDMGGNKADTARAIAIDHSGRILIAGVVQTTATNSDFGIVRLTASGQIDTTFGFNGRAVVPFESGGYKADGATALAVDALNRPVMAGWTQVDYVGDYDFAVARLTTAGQVDNTFGYRGRRVVGFNYGILKQDIANAMALDAAGRIVVAGTVSTTPGGNFDWGVIRLTSNGASLDQTFGFHGSQVIAFDMGGYKADRANALTIDSRGRILIAGSVDMNYSTNTDFGIARLTANGLLDNSFGYRGRRVVGFDRAVGGADAAFGIKVDSAGRIVVAGYVQEVGAGNYDMGVLRLTADGGALDTTFGSNGRQVVAFDLGGDKRDLPYGLAIDPWGRIVIAGSVQYSRDGDYDFGISVLFG